MDKAITRITIVLVSIYFILCYIFAQFMGIDLMRDSYIILFELCVVSYTFCSGNFHCRFMKWTALSVLFADIISHTDYYFCYIPLEWYNFFPLVAISMGLSTSITLAIRHFIQVTRLKNARKTISNKKSGISHS